jgi:hypothetical protein
MSDDFLTKTEFFQYMGKFETNLENRLTKLESKIVNGQGGVKEGGCDRGEKSDHMESLIGVLKYILVLIAGGFLTLGGVSWGQNILKILK